MRLLRQQPGQPPSSDHGFASDIAKLMDGVKKPGVLGAEAKPSPRAGS
jgi:hypothetical protein